MPTWSVYNSRRNAIAPGTYIQQILGCLTRPLDIGQEALHETKAGFLGDALALVVLLVDPQLDLLETTFCQRPLSSQSRGPRCDSPPATVWRHTVGQR